MIPGAAGVAPRLRGCRRDGDGAKDLVTLQVDVVDAHFAGFNTIHYLLETWIFDLQAVTDQGACSWIDSAVGCEFSGASFEIGVEGAGFSFAR